MKIKASFFILHSSFFIFISLLSACAPAAATPPNGIGDIRPLSVQEAGRMVIDATNTAQAVATRNTYATATRQVVVNATADARAQAEWEAKQKEEQRLRDAEAQKRELELKKIAAEATNAAAQKKRDEEAARSRELDSAQWGETWRMAVNGIIIAIVFIVIVAIVIVFLTARLYIEFRKKKAEKDHEIELIRKKLEAYALAIRETRAGTVLPMLDGRPLVINQLAGPVQTAHTPEEMDAMLSDAPPTQKIPVNDNGKTHTINRMTPDEIAQREKMMRLIRDSITYHQRKGNNGRREKQIIGWRELKKESIGEWDGDSWQAAKNLFGDILVSRSGWGTYPGDGETTLGELLDNVRYGAVKVSTPLPAEMVIEN